MQKFKAEYRDRKDGFYSKWELRPDPCPTEEPLDANYKRWVLTDVVPWNRVEVVK